MPNLSFRYPRCKQSFEGNDLEALTNTVLNHLQTQHGHAPPREHITARIAKLNS